MLDWYRLAHHLHTPKQELQKKTTSSEFCLWKEYFKRLWNEKRKEDYYFAQVSAEIRLLQKILLRKPGRISVEDSLIKFSFGDKGPDENLSAEEKLKRSKAFWFATLGIKKNG